MNIIITGALGHIGSYLIKKFSNDRKINKIVLIDNFYTQRYFSYLNINKKKISLIDSDVRDVNFNKLGKKFDFFIHLSAITNAAESFKIKKKLKNNNLNGTKKVVEFCKKTKIKLIFPSSTSVYGKKFETINSSNNMKDLFAQSPYAETKIMEEKYIRKHLTNFVILRLGTIVGVSSGMRFHTAVNKFCFQASLHKPLTVWKKFYDKKRPYLNLKDCYTAFSLVAKNNYLKGQTLDVVTKNYTVREIIEMISKIKKTKIKFVNSEILNQNSYEVDSDKLKKFMSFSKSIELEVKKTLNLLIK